MNCRRNVLFACTRWQDISSEDPRDQTQNITDSSDIKRNANDFIAIRDTFSSILKRVHETSIAAPDTATFFNAMCTFANFFKGFPMDYSEISNRKF